MINKLNYWIAWVCFFLLTIVVFGYTYLSQIDGVYVNRPVEFHYWYKNDIVTHLTTKTEYYPGEVVYAKLVAYKSKVWPAVLQWNLADGCFYAYPPRPGSLEAGRNERIVAIERIELDAKPGEDYFYGSATFDLNIIKPKIHITIRTNTFTVLPIDQKKK